MEEPELVRRCQQGDRKAQEALVDRYGNQLFRVCFRYLKSREDAEDVMITGLNKALAALPQFQYTGPNSLPAWIRRIVINESLMWLRRRNSFQAQEVADDYAHEPDLSLLTQLEADDIYSCITELPTGYRTVFNLSVIEGYSHEEIANVLGITTGTSRSQLYKAKEQLKKILTREGYQYGT
ncbi:MAG: RNA polymerase sigma factor [Cyclobacteriaceae bacterium]|nr:RNA polymerase sigma factor [Cyclobacteriaceae bacterium]HQQ83829.1 RNA polymerase sigma factor [Cyclobacteriaceae bacterium]